MTTIDETKIIDADATMAQEIREQFAAAKADIVAIEKRVSGVQSISAAGAIDPDNNLIRLTTTGAGYAVTLAAPTAAQRGKLLVIEMVADGGFDVTLALTNVVGQSAGTGATFNDVRDQLVLIAGEDRWIVLKERGVTLA